MGRRSKKTPMVKAIVNNTSSNSLGTTSKISSNETSIPMGNVISEERTDLGISILQEYSKLNSEVINLKSELQIIKALTLRSKEFYDTSIGLMKICRLVIFLSPILLYSILAWILVINVDNNVVEIITIVFSIIVGIGTLGDLVYIAFSQKSNNDNIEKLNKRVEQIERLLDDNSDIQF